MLGLHSQFGTDNPNRQIHYIDQIIMHKRYNRITKESDFALMHLQTPVSYTGMYTQSFVSTDVGFYSVKLSYRHAIGFYSYKSFLFQINVIL